MKTYLRVAAFRDVNYTDRTENFRPDYIARTIPLKHNTDAAQLEAWQDFCNELPNYTHQLLGTVTY